METTSFDLNRAIKQWRDNLSHSAAFRDENLDELQGHLCDSTAILQAAGLSQEEAFIVAMRRIGKGGILEAEFGKINRRSVCLDRMLWMLIGIQVWAIVFAIIGSLSTTAVSLGLIGGHFDFGIHSRTLPVVLLSAARLLAIVGSLVFSWWLISRKGNNLISRLEPFLKRRVALMATCTVLCVISMALTLLGNLSDLFLIKLTDVRTFGELSVSLGFSQMITSFIQVATLILLTLIIARKRLELMKCEL